MLEWSKQISRRKFILVYLKIISNCCTIGLASHVVKVLKLLSIENHVGCKTAEQGSFDN